MRSLIISLKAFLFFTILTGVAYPLLITGVSQVLLPYKANGSLINEGKVIRGSELIGQKFDSVAYFSSRPSATDYNTMPSGGSNYGLTNSKLRDLVTSRKSHFQLFNHLDSLATVPSVMLFASASGLDPHITPEAAYFQVDRIASARNFNSDQKQKLLQLIKYQTERPQLLLLGEKRVNVLLLNLEVDKIK
jgi:K+-transporting ATPase ATPase C chain